MGRIIELVITTTAGITIHLRKDSEHLILTSTWKAGDRRGVVALGFHVLGQVGKGREGGFPGVALERDRR